MGTTDEKRDLPLPFTTDRSPCPPVRRRGPDEQAPPGSSPGSPSPLRGVPGGVHGTPPRGVPGTVHGTPPPGVPGAVHGTPPPPGRKYPDYCRTLQVRDSNGGVKELVFPKALDLDRPKRARTTFSAEQLYKLEREFQRNQYLVGRDRTDLATTLQLSETQVKVWFQNRRTKYKRDNSRQAEDRKQHAEGLAACNILRMLQQHSPPTSGPAHSTTTPPHQTHHVTGSHDNGGVSGGVSGGGSGLVHTVPTIPIAVSITNRPLGISLHGSLPAISLPALTTQTTFGAAPFTPVPSRYQFPPPHVAHLAAAHAHSFAPGFFTS